MTMSPIYRLSEDGILLSPLEGKPKPEPIGAHSSSDKIWRSPKPPGKKSSALGAACPVCGIRVKASKRARHMEKVHGQEGESSLIRPLRVKTPSPAWRCSRPRIPRPVSAPGQRMVNCDICHCVIPFDQWADHKRKVHSSDWPPAAASSSSDRPRPETQHSTVAGKPTGQTVVDTKSRRSPKLRRL